MIDDDDDDVQFVRNKNSDRETRDNFTRSEKIELLHRQNNKCAICKKPLDLRNVKFDRKLPHASTGSSRMNNGRAVCLTCYAIRRHK